VVVKVIKDSVGMGSDVDDADFAEHAPVIVVNALTKTRARQ
jgi:hypothetical protein